LQDNADVKAALDERFVLLKVNMSEENKNEAFLSTLPEIKGYPAFIIADANGTVLGSQNTGDLEQGKSYSKQAILAFVAKWQDQ
jgi:hypothetical protein